MFEDIPIKFIKGTYRVKDPVDTYDSNEEKLRTAGITRITEITHLDRVKIPVFSSIRPTAQSGGVSVYAGKGATVEQARASAMMEGFERYSAEKQDIDQEKISISAYNEIKNDSVLNPRDLLLPKSFENQNIEMQKLEWIEAEEIISESPILVGKSSLVQWPCLKATPTALHQETSSKKQFFMESLKSLSVTHGVSLNLQKEIKSR